MKKVYHGNIKTGAMAIMAVLGVSIGVMGCAAQTAVPNTIKVENVEGNSNQVTVTGRESVKVVPDMAKLVFSIHTQAITAEQCQQDNAKNLDSTILKLNESGIAKESIQTSSFDMYPIYNWDSGNQEITGYEMNTQITVSDVPIDQAGNLMSQSVVSGVNSIEQVSYFCSTYDENYQEALKKAVSMAKAKATALAEAEGKSVDEVISMEEYGYNPDTRYEDSYIGAGANKYAVESGSAASDMSVMAGQVDVEASVTVTYRIK